MTLSKIAADFSVWVWDTYGKAIFDNALKKAKGKWEQFNWTGASKKYRERIIDMFGTTRVWGVTEPLKLDDIFIDVFVLRKITSGRQLDSKSVQQSKSKAYSFIHRLEREKVESALRIVTQENYLFLWGKPGSGKTTFLKYIALLSAKEKIEKIPIYISLRELSDKKTTLLSAIVKQFDICAFPEAKPFVEKVLKDGKAIVLLDGLDEIATKEGLHSVTNELEEFINRYPSCKYLITCRNGVVGVYFERFIQLEVADFQSQYIENFAHRWFAKDPKKGVLFIRNLSAQPNLRDLARTPLFLSLLCFVFNEKGEFSESRTELYNDVFNILLSEWDLSRNIVRNDIVVTGHNDGKNRSLDLETKYQILSNVAFDTFKENEIIFSEKFLINMLAEVYSIINGKQIIKELEVQHGILIEAAKRKYSFAYLNFHEYLTARYIIEKTTLSQLAINFIDPKWREVVIFLYGLGYNVDLSPDKIMDVISSDPSLERIAKWFLQTRNATDEYTLRVLKSNRGEILPGMVLADIAYAEQIQQSFYYISGMISMLDIDQFKHAHPVLAWAFNDDIRLMRNNLMELLNGRGHIPFVIPSLPLNWSIVGETFEERLISYEKWISAFEQNENFNLILWDTKQIETLINYLYYQKELSRECHEQRAGRNSRGNYAFG